MKILKHPYLPVFVSENGIIMDMERNVLEVKRRIYLEVKIASEQGESTIHRLVTETFLGPPPESGYCKIIVNHKDGDKHNNHYKNLEWCTYSENILHAFKLGLRTDNIAVELKELDTGTIYEFYSMAECSRFLGVNPAKLTRYLKHPHRVPFRLKYDCRIVGGEFKGLTVDDIVEHEYANRFYVFRRTLEGALRYYSLVQASKSTGLSKWDLRSALADPNDNEWTYNYEGEYAIVEPLLGTSPVPVRKPLECCVLTDGVGTIYPSLEAFCLEIGVKKSTVQKGISVNNGLWKQYRIWYIY